MKLYKSVMQAVSLVVDKKTDPRQYLEEVCYDNCPFMFEFSSCDECDAQHAECVLFNAYVKYDEEEGVIFRCYQCRELDRKAKKLSDSR